MPKPLKLNMPRAFNSFVKGWSATADEEIGIISLVLFAPTPEALCGRYRVSVHRVEFYRVSAEKAKDE